MESRVSEQMRIGIYKETEMMREMNRNAKISGIRFDIPVEGREINIAYYKAKQENAPLILGFHGGGYLFGGNAMNDAMWSRVSEVLDANVASVEYRKSPEYRYKEALDDAYDTYVYMQEHAGELGYDADRISVMGCSAGANLAATLCIYAKQQGNERIQKQILMYPFLDAYTDPDSKGEGSLQGPILHLFNELHCTSEEAKLPIVSPVFAAGEELQNLPEAIFCMADHDNLKKEGYDYASMLEEAGVCVHTMCSEKMPHGYFESGFGKISEGEMQFLGEEVLAMIRSGEIAKASETALQYIKKWMTEA